MDGLTRVPSVYVSEGHASHMVSGALFWRKSGMGVLMLDVILCLHEYLFVSCLTSTRRFLYDESKQSQLEDNLVKNSFF